MPPDARHNIASRLVEQARLRPDAIALREKGRSITYAELDRRSRSIAARFARDGLGTGSHILLFVPMSIALYEALIAIFRLGAAGVVVDPHAGKQHASYCCDKSRPDAFVGVRKAHLLRLMHAPIRRVARAYVTDGWTPFARRIKRDDALLDDSNREAHSVAPVTPDTPALLTFTSGSTGQPKCAIRTHGLLLAQHAALEEAIDLQPGQVDFATLPIFALANLASGLTTELTDFAAPDITRTVAAPAFFDDVERQFTDDRPLTIYTGGRRFIRARSTASRAGVRTQK
ncbi:MAG: AMP-binding protein [Tepidisphaeraceae bacterium]